MAISKTHWVLIATLSCALLHATTVRSQVLSPDAVAGSAEAFPSDSGPTTNESLPAEESHGFWSKMSVPKMSMPKVTLPKLSMPSWPKNEDGIATSPLTPISRGVSSGVKAISTGTRKAWEGTKSVFTFGGEAKTEATPIASTKPRLSLWERLKGEEPEPDGPQTVAEWMSQPRLNP